MQQVSAPAGAVGESETRGATVNGQQGHAKEALDSTARSWQSSHKCHRMEPWGDICLYENLCFDGTVLYMMRDEWPVEPEEVFWSCTSAFECKLALNLLMLRCRAHCSHAALHTVTAAAACLRCLCMLFVRCVQGRISAEGTSSRMRCTLLCTHTLPLTKSLCPSTLAVSPRRHAPRHQTCCTCTR